MLQTICSHCAVDDCFDNKIWIWQIVKWNFVWNKEISLYIEVHVKSKPPAHLSAGPWFTEITETNLEKEPKLRLPKPKSLEILSFAI